MIAEHTSPDADEPNGRAHDWDVFADLLPPFAPDPRTALEWPYADREAWRAWGEWWRRWPIAGWAAFGPMALVALALFVALTQGGA